MSEALHVWWGSQLVGELFDEEERVWFRYRPKTPSRFQVSRSLPVDDGATRYSGVFFSNLLPDGAQRERLARRLGVSEGNTIALLRAIGGDCAGALSIVPANEEPLSWAARFEPMTKEFLSEVQEKGVIAATIDAKLRLSLAGAQDKIPVVARGDDLWLPSGGAPSTHILKLPSRTYRGLCDNELFMLILARHAGLDAVTAKLVSLPHLHGQKALLVERYDRKDGERLHQEDMCQALGHPPSEKYEADGRPTLSAIIDVIRSSSMRALEDIEAIIRRQAFNCAAGNNDGHAKNVSMLREPEVRLAPAYDLVCTRSWDELSKDLALSVGGRKEAGFISPAAWRDEAKKSAVGPKRAVEIFEETIEAVKAGAKLAAEEAMEAGADGRAVRNALSKVEKQVRGAARQVSLDAKQRRP